MDHSTLANGWKIRSMEKACTSGTMVESTRAIGKITTWMVLEFTRGKMVVNTKDSTRRIKNMGKVHTPGQTAGSTMVNG